MTTKRFCSLGWLALLGLAVSNGHAQPANDLFVNRIILSGTNVVTSGNNIDATKEVGEPYIAGNAGGHSVWWSWTAPAGGTVTIRTSGSSFDTTLGVYTGSLVTALTLVAGNDDDPDAGDLTSKVVFDVPAGQACQIGVDGFSGDAGSIVLTLQYTPAQPPPPAPAWTLPDLYGQTINSTNYAGKVVVLDFWATWCGPCVAEIPDLIALQSKYGGDGLVIVGASVDSDPQTVLNFETTTPLNYQVVMANAAVMAAYGGIPYIPTTFIISRQNLIMKKYVGTQSFSTFEKQIVPLLYNNTRVTAQLSANQLVLCWPTNALNFTLESAAMANLVWTPWPTAPAKINGTNVVTTPLTATNRFFRLRLDY